MVLPGGTPIDEGSGLAVTRAPQGSPARGANQVGSRSVARVRTKAARWLYALAVLTAAEGAPVRAVEAASTSAPWAVWEDLRALAVVPSGDQTRLRSSHCPDGCFADRQSPGDPRRLRLDGSESVIFEESGPGAITRIWMTTGDGLSDPLPLSVRVRFYLDGELMPRLDLPLADLFGGEVEPFTAPLAGDRLSSSGGYFSYVPIAYRHGCRVTLEGADGLFLWYQLTFHQLPADRPVATYTGGEDLAPLRALLAAPGADPWPPSGTTLLTTGELSLVAGAEAVVLADAGPGSITGLWLDAAPSTWPFLAVRLAFDGERTVDLPASDLFGTGRGAGAVPIRSLLAGVDASGALYAFFPMPFARDVRVALANLSPVGGGPDPLVVAYRLRREPGPPPADSGRFAATLTLADPAPAGEDLVFLASDRPGKWVGLWAELGSVATLARSYLEGDERIYVDGARHPAHYGTGIEDFFGGGFYFDQGSFGLALHGMTYHRIGAGEDTTAAYRLLLGDAVPFARSIRAGLEPGPEGDVPMRARIVAWHYLGELPPLRLADALDVGDTASRAAHGYVATAPITLQEQAGEFEGEPPLALLATIATREASSTATFDLAPRGCACAPLPAPGCDDGRRLRRLFDATEGDQRLALAAADLSPLGSFPFGEPNSARRWRELDLDLPFASDTRGLRASGDASTVLAFNEVRYELWCRPETPLFADGFESGTTARWSAPSD